MFQLDVDMEGAEGKVKRPNEKMKEIIKKALEASKELLSYMSAAHTRSSSSIYFFGI
jgi:hypothetical protein